MKDWQPIETYDKLKKKPALAVFWFSAVPNKRSPAYGLRACANLSRTMGNRECVLWMPLTEPTEEI